MKKQRPTLSNQYPFLVYIFFSLLLSSCLHMSKKNWNRNVVISVQYKNFWAFFLPWFVSGYRVNRISFVIVFFRRQQCAAIWPAYSNSHCCACWWWCWQCFCIKHSFRRIIGTTASMSTVDRWAVHSVQQYRFIRDKVPSSWAPIKMWNASKSIGTTINSLRPNSSGAESVSTVHPHSCQPIWKTNANDYSIKMASMHCSAIKLHSIDRSKIYDTKSKTQ